MSLLKTIKAQLGLSVTPANNFVLDASADNGTMKLARGNAGATTQDIMTVNADGTVTFPQGGGGLPTVAFQARRTTSQAVSSSVWATILFDTEEMDTSSAYTPGTGRFTPQTAGWYQFNAAIGFNGTSITALGLAVVKNGTASAAITYLSKNSTSGGQSLSVSGLVYLNGTTDYITCQGLVTAGGGPTLDVAAGPMVFSAFLMKQGA